MLDNAFNPILESEHIDFCDGILFSVNTFSDSIYNYKQEVSFHAPSHRIVNWTQKILKFINLFSYYSKEKREKQLRKV